MRIIAGSARGRRIESPRGEGTRPTHDRVREAVFSMLGAYFDGGHVLDLFAGSGALGLEAISRGADSCVFCDRDRNAARVVTHNAQTLGFEKACRVLCSPWQHALETCSGHPFDLIFLDPPYEAGYLLPALERIDALALLRDGGTIVCEMRSNASLQAPACYRAIKEKSYGMARVILLQKASDSAKEGM